MNKKTHKFHIVDPSPWPLMCSLGLIIFFLSFSFFMRHQDLKGVVPFLCCTVVLCITIFFWFRDILKESLVQGVHNKIVQNGFKIGMMVFISTEIMLFVAYFWSFFNAELLDFPITSIVEYWNKSFSSIAQDAASNCDTIKEHAWVKRDSHWPPIGIESVDFLGLPFLNTCILLMSGTTITYGHYSLITGDKKNLLTALRLTIFLAVLFLIIQGYEFYHAEFKIKSLGECVSIANGESSSGKALYASNFYMLTGLHGLHVICGSLFIIVCFFIAKNDLYTKENHVGFELATWYWHFVDVVWILLFIFVYVLV